MLCTLGSAGVFLLCDTLRRAMKTSTSFLRLLHLADSALPIGSAAHSYGLETLASAGYLAPATLADFLRGYLMENGLLEAAFCRRGALLGARAADAPTMAAWLALNYEMSALKTARESREASLKLGHRLLYLVADLEEDQQITTFLTAAERGGAGVHHACAFGLAGGRLGVDADLVVAAFLRQSVAGLVAACQKFMALGQSHAASIQWQLYDQIDALAQAPTDPATATVFAPLTEIASMRHPYLPVRLFVS